MNLSGLVVNQFIIRTAVEADVPAVCSLIRELRSFHECDPSVISEEKFKKYLFGDKACSNVEIAEVDKKIVGLAIFNLNFAGFQGDIELRLEDLYVQPSFQKQGIGTALLKKVTQVALEKECCRMAWEVSTWNQKAFEFYKKLGGMPRDDLTLVRMNKKDMKRLAN